ncbi:DUF2817 domain-containing protein [Saccharophagus degradans]|uniref:DUF2817 domain-containing protein n=1 Tax=Saccharophagus degradans TaxID=86304 RepID=UPI001C09802A|nr:DUF2817 domain-containing protein [Saccharophagus degradans]MBU2985260.1 DUF2817 domain-containing protein [Saccharophagus degradans]
METLTTAPLCENLPPLPQRTIEERRKLKIKLPELLWIEKLMRKNAAHMHVRTEYTLHHDDMDLPIYSLTLGSQKPASPTLLVTGGVHGLERIGTQVILSWLQTLLERCRWDAHTKALLAQIHIVILPLVNPVGMLNNTRSNGNGIDLNRHAPVQANEKTPFLAGGHRLGNWLPWYRGKTGAELEPELAVMIKVFKRYMQSPATTLGIDLHSGFGFHDRLWFPYAYSKEPISNISDYVALKLMWERNYPHHNYLFEPQSMHYCTHGDIWDYLYDLNKAEGNSHFLPLTLEMGSWNWVKKRPRQIFNFNGLFNPQLPHRRARVLRDHLVLLDFLCSATLNHEQWQPDKKMAESFAQMAQGIWYKARQ